MLDIGNRAILRVLVKGIKSSNTPEEDLNELLTYIEESFPDKNISALTDSVGLIK